jgi:uncharacterized membrane protein (UPF0127 family)
MGCSTTHPALSDAISDNQQESNQREAELSPSRLNLPFSQSQSSPGQFLPISGQAEMAGELIQLEVARTVQEQAMGLMFRPALPDDRGMLFLLDPPRSARFWMRHVPVPLDMVFMLNGEVKAIAANVPPCTTPACPVYGPDTAVNQVIELRGGRASELGLQVGDQVTIEFLAPQ